jgi:hypothetical protein
MAKYGMEFRIENVGKDKPYHIVKGFKTKDGVADPYPAFNGDAFVARIMFENFVDFARAVAVCDKKNKEDRPAAQPEPGWNG